MTTQLQNQDPFAPMDNTAMVEQMAQFSQVTGITEMSQTLKGIADQLSEFHHLPGRSQPVVGLQRLAWHPARLQKCRLPDQKAALIEANPLQERRLFLFENHRPEAGHPVHYPAQECCRQDFSKFLFVFSSVCFRHRQAASCSEMYRRR